MKIIFTDIDGVLNCKRTPNPRKFPYVVDPPLLDRFRALVDRTEAKVVLSSTWRYDPAGKFSAQHWGIPFIDVIPDFPDKPRRDEILAWLANRSEVERYVVLDDEDDELDGLPLFQPSSRTGLTDEIAAGIEAYLAGKTDKDMRCSRLRRTLQNVKAMIKQHEG
jgi:HAD domain in Swiss Army Knife RNA repair proteins